MQKIDTEKVNRSNYTPMPNEKHLVHYKAELVRHNVATGKKVSHPEIIKTGLKMFPTVKRDLEKQGYTIEIIYHPQGKYNTPIPTVEVDEKEAEIEALKAQIEKLSQKEEVEDASVKLAEKDAEIAALKAQLEAKPTETKAKKTTKKTTKKEEK